MILECVANEGEDLPPEMLDPSANLTERTKFPLVIGKKYTVHAFILRPPHSIWYYVYTTKTMCISRFGTRLRCS